MLCRFLLYNNVNQLQVYRDPLIEPPSHPTPSPPLYVIRAELPDYTAASQKLSMLHAIAYKWQCYSVNLSHPLLALEADS